MSKINSIGRSVLSFFSDCNVSSRLSNGVFISFILICIFFVYYDTIFQAPRADHLIYFGMAHGIDGFWSQTFGSYALNRDFGADAVLFRPLLYIFLGFQYYFFGHDYVYWQITSIVLHALICVTLYFILNRALRNNILAFLLTVAFGVHFAGTEMVSWSHLTGYLLFCLAVVQSIYYFQIYNEGKSSKHLYLSLLWTAVAAFSYEAGNFLAVLIALGLGCKAILGPQKVTSVIKAVPFLCVPIAFIVISKLDLAWRPLGDSGIKPFDLDTVFATLWGSLVYMVHWIGSGILPAFFSMRTGGRIEVNGFYFNFDLIGIINIIGVIALLVAVALVLRQAKQDRRLLPSLDHSIGILILLLLAGLYTAMIVFGRGLERGLMGVYTNNSYYSYKFLLFSVMAFGFAFASPLKGAKTALTVLLCIGLGVLAFVNAMQTTAVHSAMRYDYAEPRYLLAKRVIFLKDRHESRTGHTTPEEPYGVVCAVNDVLPWYMFNRPDYSYSFAEILWPEGIVRGEAGITIECVP